MNRRRCGIALAFAAAVVAALAAGAWDAGGADQPAPLEPWADARLPVTAGLSLWLDAARQSAARKAIGRLAPVGGGPLDRRDDRAGHPPPLPPGLRQPPP